MILMWCANHCLAGFCDLIWVAWPCDGHIGRLETKSEYRLASRCLSGYWPFSTRYRVMRCTERAWAAAVMWGWRILFFPAPAGTVVANIGDNVPLLST